MIVRTLDECRDTNRHIKTDNWESVRMSLKDDNMGFSFHITTIKAGTETPIHYLNHLETVYCISGDGEVQTESDGKVYQIRPGTVYILDQHDKHLLRGGKEDMQLACVFNPALHGKEVHDENGVYPLDAEAVKD
ncbi:ectoine synthase [Marinobacteraceae bacterium S3BR75-40.1]